MSTRCQIEFKVDGERRTIYRHSDGYPDSKHGVVETLKQFLKWNRGRNTDIEYLTANFIFWSKLQGIVDSNEFAKEFGSRRKQETLESLLESPVDDVNHACLGC